MEYETIKLEIEDRVATVTLNRPEIRNAMNNQMAAEVSRAFDEIAADKTLRALVLTGAGKSFCSGGDISSMSAQFSMEVGERPEALLGFYRSFLKVRDLEIPTIAAINGHAMGAGLSFALACDLRLAAETAKLGLSFIKIGLHPGMGSCYMLTRLVGTARALELLWTGDVLTAREAAEIGIVNRVVSAEELAGAARGLALKLAKSPPLPISMIKATVYSAWDSSLDSILRREASAQTLCTLTEDFAAGISAFLENRTRG